MGVSWRCDAVQLAHGRHLLQHRRLLIRQRVQGRSAELLQSVLLLPVLRHPRLYVVELQRILQRQCLELWLDIKLV